MAKHAADDGGFFGLFKKKKESYYDFSDTSRTKKRYEGYEDKSLEGLKKDYTSVTNYTNVEGSVENDTQNLSSSSNNVTSIQGKTNSGSSATDTTQEVESVSSVPLNEEEFNNSYNTYVKNHDSEYEYEYEDDDEEDGNGKKILIALIIILLIVALIATYFMFFNKPKEEEEPVEEEVVQEEGMIKTLGGAKVLGKISIDEIGVDKYILDSTSETALKEGVGKIDNGAKLDTNGNFCIAGHNEEGVFKDLSNVIEGTEIKITDRNFNEMIYEVKEFREVAPDDLECLLQDETREKITLITCKEGATERLLVIAERK